MRESAVDIAAADAKALAAYRTFCGCALYAAPQAPVWIESWTANVNPDGLIVTLRQGARPVMMLALEIVRYGPFRVARFMGDSHANGNFPAFAPSASPEPAALRAMARAMREVRPDIDLVALERQNPAQAATPNPLLPLATAASPNVALAVDLEGGFAALLARRNGARKLKKVRQQARHFEELGGYRIGRADTQGEVERVLGAFFAMKRLRLARQGIADVFAAPALRSFFTELFVKSLAEPSRPFFLSVLEAGGKILAVDGLSRDDHATISQFSAIGEESNRLAPGFMLKFANVEQACTEGKRIFDFSVGDEPYKRSWADIETRQFDCFLPLTAKGRLLDGAMRLRGGAVRIVKSNDRLWAFTKKARERLRAR